MILKVQLPNGSEYTVSEEPNGKLGLEVDLPGLGRKTIKVSEPKYGAAVISGLLSGEIISITASPESEDESFRLFPDKKPPEEEIAKMRHAVEAGVKRARKEIEEGV